MKLALMKGFYDTVEDGKSPILDAIASRWFESSDNRMVRASANFVVRVKSGVQVHYLRFNHEDERSIPHIENELTQRVKRTRSSSLCKMGGVPW